MAFISKCVILKEFSFIFIICNSKKIYWNKILNIAYYTKFCSTQCILLLHILCKYVNKRDIPTTPISSNLNTRRPGARALDYRGPRGRVRARRAPSVQHPGRNRPLPRTLDLGMSSLSQEEVTRGRAWPHLAQSPHTGIHVSGSFILSSRCDKVWGVAAIIGIWHFKIY